MRNGYKILGIDKNATQQQIDIAYFVLSSPKRQVSDKYLQNPDLDSLIWAHTILSDPIKRKEHDESLFIFSDDELEYLYTDLVNFLYFDKEDWLEGIKHIANFNSAENYDKKVAWLKILSNVEFRGNYVNLLMFLGINVEEYIKGFDSSNYERKKELYTDVYNMYLNSLVNKGRVKC